MKKYLLLLLLSSFCLVIWYQTPSLVASKGDKVDHQQVLTVSPIAREANIERLKNTFFDLVIIGGGSAGLGAAVESTNRGLKVALIEAQDFAAETSSRSTKLLHGGVRYLEQAVKTLFTKGEFDKTLFNLITDALYERDVLLQTAPHLTKPLSIVTPLYTYLEVPYYLAGLKLYDFLAGERKAFPGAWFISAGEIIKRYPTINATDLKGGVEYYDGQFNDARMAMALALTAQSQGGTLANHTRATGFLKDEKGKITGVTAEDALTGETFVVRGKVVINATGPFCDQIRRMDNPNAQAMVTTSSGTHLILPPDFSSPEGGILVPKTDDGRVLFILPWEGYTLVGTTDDKAPLQSDPQPKAEEVDYLLKQVSKYYRVPPTKSDVLVAWTGLRPLVADPRKADTAQLARDHVVQASDSQLVTIVGGKWTTYRKMALDVVESALKVVALETQFPNKHTENLILVGGGGYSPALASLLQEKFKIEADIADHLVHSYGDQAAAVLTMGGATHNVRLVEGLPFLEAEVLYGYRVESARTPADILARRMRIAFLDERAAAAALPRVAALLNSCK